MPADQCNHPHTNSQLLIETVIADATQFRHSSRGPNLVMVRPRLKCVSGPSVSNPIGLMHMYLQIAMPQRERVAIEVSAFRRQVM